MSGIVVDGYIIDSAGVERGYVILQPDGRIAERGKSGTLGLTDLKVHKGVILPRPGNGHTHLGDSVWEKEPPPGPLSDIVKPPGGLKHRLLAETPRSEKVRAMHDVLCSMCASGVGCTLDFREEGLEGVRMLREASKDLAIQPFILGRPTGLHGPQELGNILKEADGLGLSALKDMGLAAAQHISTRVREAGKCLALHASEDSREPIGDILDLRPFLLVHLTKATPEDLQEVVSAGVSMAFCARSNALFGNWPPIAEAARIGAKFVLGTDNVMFNSPDLFAEMEFTYVAARLHHEVLPPEKLVRSVFITPWDLIGKPEAANLIPGNNSKAIALKLGGKDPYYEVCARAGQARMISHPSA